jgi:hypothetical protein
VSLFVEVFAYGIAWKDVEIYISGGINWGTGASKNLYINKSLYLCGS